MSAEFEINVGEEKEPDAAEKMADEAEKKQKLETLYSTLKKLMTGQIKASPGEIEMMKKQTVKAIAEEMED